MSKLILLRGLPAAGKSTKAKEIIKETGNTVRVNKDLLREMLHFNKWTGKNEDLTLKAEKFLATDMLYENYNVVVDDTNLNLKIIEQWKQVAKDQEAKFEEILVSTSYQECIHRDLARKAAGDRYVGKEVIINMARRYKLYESDKKDVICDLDGTLADIKHRLHFVKGSVHKDWHAFFSDIPHDLPRSDVLDKVIELQKRYNIVIVTGRPEDYKEVTLEWLHKFGIPYETIIMRRKGDTRNDDIIKKEILDTYFDKNKVELVIDDRPRVIRMWREEGLTVEDVGTGVEF